MSKPCDKCGIEKHDTYRTRVNLIPRNIYINLIHKFGHFENKSLYLCKQCRNARNSILETVVFELIRRKHGEYYLEVCKAFNKILPKTRLMFKYHIPLEIKRIYTDKISDFFCNELTSKVMMDMYGVDFNNMSLMKRLKFLASKRNLNEIYPEIILKTVTSSQEVIDVFTEQLDKKVEEIKYLRQLQSTMQIIKNRGVNDES